MFRLLIHINLKIAQGRTIVAMGASIMDIVQTLLLRLLMVVATASAIVVSDALAADEGQVADGQLLAREWCSRCHNIELGGPFKQHPPSFSAIAVYRSKDQIYARITIPPLHSNMPSLGYILTPENVNSLVAYIRSLEAR